MTAQVEDATMETRLPRYCALVLTALLLQLLTPLSLNLLARIAYSEYAWVTPATVLPLSQLWLAVTGISGTVLAIAAMYSSLRQARLALALPLVLLCVIALGASLFYVYAFLAFQGWL